MHHRGREGVLTEQLLTPLLDISSRQRGHALHGTERIDPLKSLPCLTKCTVGNRLEIPHVASEEFAPDSLQVVLINLYIPQHQVTQNLGHSIRIIGFATHDDKTKTKICNVTRGLRIIDETAPAQLLAQFTRSREPSIEKNARHQFPTPARFGIRLEFSILEPNHDAIATDFHSGL